MIKTLHKSTITFVLVRFQLTDRRYQPNTRTQDENISYFSPLHVQIKPFGKLHEAYLPRYIIVAEIMSHDENPPLLFCKTAQRRATGNCASICVIIQ